MKNRKLILILSLVLALTMSLGGTLAYLTDTDADVNTMVLGNVKIEQHEYERVVDAEGNYEMVTSEKYGEGYKVQEFSQNKPLLPAVGAVSGTPGNDYGTPVYWDQLGKGASGGQQVLKDIENIQDKFVLVENTGNTNAYVRTYIAYEAGSKTVEEWDALVKTSSGNAWDCDFMDTLVAINGNNYVVAEYVYVGTDVRHTGGILPAGEYTYNNLAQIYLMPEATNEDLIALDGNKNGTYDIIVLSQAVQAAGFSDAVTALNTGFGEATAIYNAEEGQTEGDWNVDVWLENASTSLNKVYTEVSDVKAAIAAGEDKVVLGSGTFTAADFGMNNSDVVIAGTKDTVIDVAGTPNLNGSNVTFEGVTISGTTDNYKGLQHSGKITYKNCVFNNAMHLYGTEEVFEDCTFNLTTNYIWTYGAGKVTFKNCTFNTDGKAILVYSEGGSLNQEVNVIDCTFNATASAYAGGFANQPCAAVEIDSSLVSGYTVNFSGTNKVDYDFCGLVRIKKDKTPSNVTINGATVTETIK